MNDVLRAASGFVGGIILLAIVAVLMSRRAQTPEVLTAAGGALGNVIRAAVSPVGEGGGSFGGGGGGGGFDRGDAIDLINTAGKYFL